MSGFCFYSGWFHSSPRFFSSLPSITKHGYREEVTLQISRLRKPHVDDTAKLFYNFYAIEWQEGSNNPTYKIKFQLSYYTLNLFTP